MARKLVIEQIKMLCMSNKTEHRIKGEKTERTTNNRHFNMML